VAFLWKQFWSLHSMAMWFAPTLWRHTLADVRLWLPASIMTGALIADLLRGLTRRNLRLTASSSESSRRLTASSSESSKAVAKGAEQRIALRLHEALAEVQKEVKWHEWCEAQRDAHRKGELSSGQVRYLNDLGFAWGSSD